MARIQNWKPEDPTFWKETGYSILRKSKFRMLNLLIFSKI